MKLPGDFMKIISPCLVAESPAEQQQQESWILQQVVQYELGSRRALCRGLMEVCSAFTLHLYLF